MQHQTKSYNAHRYLITAIVSLFISGSLLAQKNIQSFENLLADQVRQNKEKQRLDSIWYTQDSEDEGDLFETSGLYEGVWNNRYVNPYGKIQLPDSFRINTSKFEMPHMGYITSNYGQRRRRFHYGIDLKVQIGDPIVSAFDGTVRITARERGYGIYIVIRHDNGLETVYGHLSRIDVSEGQEVSAGEQIGLGGNTGRSTGPHLHFETRFLGQPINPSDIFDFANKVTHRDSYMFYPSRSGRYGGATQANRSQANHKVTYAGGKTHRVRNGDTLGSIARKYGTSVEKLCKLNNITKVTILSINKALRVS